MNLYDKEAMYKLAKVCLSSIYGKTVSVPNSDRVTQMNYNKDKRGFIYADTDSINYETKTNN